MLLTRREIIVIVFLWILGLCLYHLFRQQILLRRSLRGVNAFDTLELEL